MGFLVFGALILLSVAAQGSYASGNNVVVIEPPVQVSSIPQALTNDRALVTQLDFLRDQFIGLRHLSLSLTDINKVYRKNVKQGKAQRPLPLNVPFPCNLTNARSASPPKTVNRLRPGDIDIIAAMGDSASSGNCEISDSVLQIFNEFRGFAFSGGGAGTWRQFLTLPNILKEFNPNLYGYATSYGLTVDGISHLNVAEPMLMSPDLPFQTRVLIDRMRRDPKVDMERHWKLVTLYLGSVEFCSRLCHESVDEILRKHEEDLTFSLRLLRDNVPHLLVNLMPMPNGIQAFREMPKKFLCQYIHTMLCFCVSSNSFNETEHTRRVRRWQAIDEYVSSLTEFQTDDFAVVFHPFMREPRVPLTQDGKTDLKFFAADCFHFSQYGNAALANSLWNSMLQPVAQKQLHATLPFQHFECPSEAMPFIRTWQNSFN